MPKKRVLIIHSGDPGPIPNMVRKLGYLSAAVDQRSFLDTGIPAGSGTDLILYRTGTISRTAAAVTSRLNALDLPWIAVLSRPGVRMAARLAEGGSFGVLFEPLEEGVLAAQLISAFHHYHDRLRRIIDSYRDTEELFETSLNAIPDLIGIQRPDHSIIRYNTAGYRFLGLTHDQVKGKKCYELIGRKRKCDICATTETLRTRQIAEVERYEPSMDIWINVRAYPILNEKGEIVKIVEHLRDITRQKRSEQALRESEEKLRQIFDNVNDAIYLHTFSDSRLGPILEVNQAAIDRLGYSREEYLSMTPADFDEPETIKRAPEVLEKLIEQGHMTFETVHRSRDGKKIPVEINAHLFRIGKETRILSIARDISERKSQDERFRRQFDALTFLEKQQQLHMGDFRKAVRLITEKASQAMSVERVGVWLFDRDRTAIECFDLYERTTGRHSSGNVLLVSQAPDYFRALEESFCISAPDARNDERTKLLAGDYLIPLNIRSMLDAPIQSGDRHAGVICFEHVGECRSWSSDEEIFSGTMADFVSLALKAKELNETTNVLRRTQYVVDRTGDMVIWTDENQRLIEVNESACRGLDYSRDELLTRSVPDIDVDFVNVRTNNTWKQLQKQGTLSFESKYRKKSGEIYPVEVTSNLIRFEGKRYVCSFARDISERKSYEAALKESEEKYRNLIQESNDAIYLLYNRRFEIINHQFEKMFEVELSDVNHSGFDFMELVAPESREVIIERMEKASRGESLSPKYEFTAISRTGKRIEVETAVTYVPYKDGIATQGIIRDITERKTAERRIRDSLKEKEMLLREIHHRVKNNMQVISSLLNLQSSTIDNPQVQAILRESQQRIRSMALVHQKLYQSRNLASIDFSEYVRSLVQYLYQSYHIDTGHIELVMDLEDIELNIDQAIPCGLILNELISNALKYAFRGPRKRGRIKVGLRRSSSGMELEVSDNGCGLPPDVDIKNSRTLGLKLVSILAEEQLGGSVSVRVSKGTAFKIRFHAT